MILFSYSIEASQHSDPFLWNIALLSKIGIQLPRVLRANTITEAFQGTLTGIKFESR